MARRVVSALRRSVARFWLWAAVLVAAVFVIAALYWALVPLPSEMVAPTPSAEELDRIRAVNEARRTVAQIVGGFVVIVAGVSTAWLTNRRVNALEKQVALQVEGHVTDRLSRGIEQLGATSDSGPTPEIRAGGVFTLERVAKESPASFEPVFQILMGYLRTHSVRKAGEQGVMRTELRMELRMDVEAALAAFERLVPLRGLTEASHRVVLPQTNLPSANLSGANLVGANLIAADLSGVVYDERTVWPAGFSPPPSSQP